MTSVDVLQRHIGITFSTQNGCEVLVWAPRAEQVALCISDSEKKIELQKKERGYWSGNVADNDIYPGVNYFIEVNGISYPDPASVFQPLGFDGPSQTVDLNAFKWQDKSWENVSLSDYIIYELHVGTFTPEGTFAGVESKLEYLKQLGITAIEIMPIAQFPGTRNWGYDGIFPFAAQNSYGGPAALQHLVNTCHHHGLAVILDVVYNHFGPEGNNNEKFGSYLTEKYKTPWGGAVNFDDAECDAVRKYFVENVLMWFRDFHVDAVRLDAVHAIKDFSPVHILKEIRQHVDALMSLTGRIHYLLVECDLNDSRFIRETERDGYGMHAQWIDEFHHALRVTTGQERTGYYKDFDGIVHLAKSFKDAYVYDGVYSNHRKKTFGTKTDNIPDDKFIVFSQNHDQVGNRMLGERSSVLISFDLQKVLTASVLMSPYLPLLFMGEEYGERNPFLYFTDFASEELIESVRTGRKKEFADFHGEGETPDPQAITSFEKSKLNWNLLNKRKHFILLGYYNQLIKCRKNRPKVDRRKLEVKAFEEQKVLILRSTSGKFSEIYFFNFSNKEQVKEVESVKGRCEIIFNSDDAKWLGSAASIQRSKPHEIIIPPESFLILKFNNV